MELFRLLGTVAINGTDEVKSELQKTTGAAQDSESKITSAFKKIGTAVVTYFAVDKIRSFGNEITNITADFEDSMLKVQSLSGASTEEYDKLTEAALNYGSTTAWTSKDVANAMGYMALAGFNTNEILASTGGMLNLASASGEELATVTDILTDSMTAFGDGAEDASRYADVLATTQAKSNTTVGLLGEAFKYAAPLAGSYKYELEDVATSLGIMANAGVKGSMAGTALSSIITRLGTDVDGCRTRIEEMGIEFYNQDGTARDLSLVFKELADATSDYTAEEKASIAKSIAGQEAQKGLLAILNQGSGAYAELESTIKNCSGTAQDMAENMESGVGGATRSLDSATEGLKISLGQVFSDDTNGIIRDMAKWISDKLTPKATEFAKKGLAKIKDILSWIDKKMPTIQNITKKTGDILSNIFKKSEPVIEWLIEKALPKFLDMLEFLVENFELIAGTAATVIGVLKGFSVVSTLTTAVKGASGAWEAFNAVLSANPIGAVITSVGLLVGGIVLLSDSFETQKEKEEKARKEMEEYKEKSAEAKNAAIERRDEIDKLTEKELGELQVTKDLWAELQTLCDENGNVKDADYDRAKFITNQLSEALGIEFEWTGKQIQNYKDLQTEINNTLKAKEAFIHLGASEAKYQDAIENKMAAEEKQAEQAEALEKAWIDLQKVKAEHDKRRAEWQSITDPLEKADAEVKFGEWVNQYYQPLMNQYEKARMDYENTTAELEGYYDSIAQYENAFTMYEKGEYDSVIDYLDKVNSARITAVDIAKETTAEQLEQIRQQTVQSGIAMEEMRLMLENCSADEKDFYTRMYNERKEQFVEDAKLYAAAGGKNAQDYVGEIVSTMQAYSPEFSAIGLSSVLDIVNGVNSGKGELTDSVNSALDEAGEEAKAKRSKFEEIGKYVTEGIASGMGQASITLVNTTRKLIQSSLDEAKNVAMIQSPSRLFAKEVGAYIPSGVGMGIEDNMDDAIDPMRDMIGRMSNIGHDDVTNNYNSHDTSIVNNYDNSGNQRVVERLDALLNVCERIISFISDGTEIQINNREFARLVRQVNG